MTERNPPEDPLHPPPERPGRRAKLPYDLDARLGDLVKLTESWLNRYDEVWFMARLLEQATGAAKDPSFPDR